MLWVNNWFRIKGCTGYSAFFDIRFPAGNRISGQTVKLLQKIQNKSEIATRNVSRFC